MRATRRRGSARAGRVRAGLPLDDEVPELRCSLGTGLKSQPLRRGSRVRTHRNRSTID